MTKTSSTLGVDYSQVSVLLGESVAWRAPKHLLLMMATAVFAVETLVMFLLPLLPELSTGTEALLDSTLLLVVLSPTLYFFHYRPLELHHRAHQLAAGRLLQSEERLRLAQAATNDGLWDWNLPAESVYYNPRFSSMLGYSRDDLKPFPKVWKRLLHPAERTLVLTRLKEHLAGESEHYRVEHRVKTAGGGWLWVLARGQVVSRDAAGRPLRMVGTLTDISDRKLAEQALRGRKQQIHKLSQQLMRRSEEEKRHLAQDIHDEFGQVLSAFQLGVEMLKRHQYAGEEDYQQQCSRLLGMVNRLEMDIRHISRHLRPVMLDDLGLLPTLQTLAKEISAQLPDLAVDFSALPLPRRFERDTEVAFYRICQEALHNILKHATATVVHISLDWDADQVTLVVQDDGQGFVVTPQQQRDSHWGMGLIGMRERAEAVGGTCAIHSQSGQGTTVVCSLPARFVEDELCRKSAS